MNLTFPPLNQFARVVDLEFVESFLSNEGYSAHPKDDWVFITLYDEIAGLSETQVYSKLNVNVRSNNDLAIIIFRYQPDYFGQEYLPREVLFSVDPLWIPGGKTAGGAPEWLIPNRLIGDLPIDIVDVITFS